MDEGKVFEFFLIPMSQIKRPPPQNKKDRIKIHGVAVRSNEDKIYIELDRGTKKLNLRELYFIEFVCNRMPVQMEHQAMSFMKEHGLSKFFFGDRRGVSDLQIKKLSNQLEMLNLNKM